MRDVPPVEDKQILYKYVNMTANYFNKKAIEAALEEEKYYTLHDLSYNNKQEVDDIEEVERQTKEDK